jgi:hypothetical protein
MSHELRVADRIENAAGFLALDDTLIALDGFVVGAGRLPVADRVLYAHRAQLEIQAQSYQHDRDQKNSASSRAADHDTCRNPVRRPP